MTGPSRFQLIAAPVTVFGDDGELDLGATRTLFGWLHECGVDGLFTPGTTGEFTALDDDERLRVIEAALEEFGADDVIAHVGGAAARQTMRLAQAAQRAGATRLAAITPYYFPAGDEALVEYVKRVTDVSAGASVYLYVFPSRAVTTVAPEALARVAEVPGLVGAKVSGLSFAENEAYRAAVPDGFELYSGNDVDLVRLAEAGYAGVVSGVSNVFPELFVRAARAARSGQDDSELQPRIDAAVAATGAADIGLLKAGLTRRGLEAGIPRISINPPTREQLAALESSAPFESARHSL
ncbi:dihydrodipicolinate synthase family protein [Gryllotalpicola protaetiae]|uniref:Dihydrodipicolinate synthase family protein n=1 Tax=Gryllotalpicola protaetiae TaxID=2419771 RepID=A0A387BQ48_9MICO|nr:dihydrodipicolinate synthase family protein [Gryllotalpicola protaetiae]AYG03239.1 dihydrodipicolinate synthase family protein [Gryllotalpicola protaetiae]